MAELTISETAATLGVSVDTIRRKIKRGEMQAHQDPRGKYLVEVEASPDGSVPQPPSGLAGPAEVARLRIELEHSNTMVEELRHQRETLETELQGARQALQEAAKASAELRQLLGQEQALQMQRALPPAEKHRHWYWPWGKSK